MSGAASAVGGRTWSPPSLRPVLFMIGGVLLALAAAMLLPMALDLAAGDPDWRAFAISAAVTAAVGGALFWGMSCSVTGGLGLRQSFLLTPLSYAAVAIFAALPLLLSRTDSLRGNLPNAVFEAMSGITTTGATVIIGLDHAPAGVLLWRALLQWMGGIGIIAVAVAILPALGVGGMQLFRTESSDRSEKVMPRVRQIAAGIGMIYLTLTVVCALAYWAAGMALFDAVAHALSTVSTAGFSTADSSLAKWDLPAIHWIATFFMLSGALPFVVYLRALRGDHAAWFDSQVRTLLLIVGVIVAALTVWLVVTERYGVTAAIRHAAFNVVSVVTTTGFATADYGLWGDAAVGLFFGLTLLGGCTGSTSGGLKVFRFEVMGLMMRGQFRTLLHPRGVFPALYGGRRLPDDVVASVMAFVALYFACHAALTTLLMAHRLDFLTSASAAVSMLSNVGPGLGDIIGPAGNYASVPDGAKWLLCIGMLLGRLELFAVLILFMPRFWRG